MTPYKKLFFVFFVMTSVGCAGPIGPFPGGELQGTVAQYPNSWLPASDVTHVQLETRDRENKPHSINIWSVVLGDRMFFSTSLVRGEENPEKREWVQNVLNSDGVRVKVSDQIYEGKLTRVLDEETVQGVKEAFTLKYDRPHDERTDKAWIFELAKQ